MADGWLYHKWQSISEPGCQGPEHAERQSLDGLEAWLVPAFPLPLVCDGYYAVPAEVTRAAFAPGRIRIDNGIWYRPDKILVSQHTVIYDTPPCPIQEAEPRHMLTLLRAPTQEYRPDTPELFPAQPFRRRASSTSSSDWDDSESDRIPPWQSAEGSRSLPRPVPRSAQRAPVPGDPFDFSDDSSYVAPSEEIAKSYFDGSFRLDYLTPNLPAMHD
jgi:hypothetical protein